MKRFISNEKGQALVELALILPLLLVLLLGIIDFGRVFHGYLTITHAAREGARIGAVRAEDSEVITIIINSTSSLNSSDLSYDISPSKPERKPGQKITVKLVYEVHLITPFLNSIIPNPVVLQAETTMRVE